MGIKIFAKRTPKRVENAEVKRIGSTISLGLALCRATLTAIREAGKSCKEVAFKIKNIAEAYSAWGELSKRLAALMP